MAEPTGTRVISDPSLVVDTEEKSDSFVNTFDLQFASSVPPKSRFSDADRRLKSADTGIYSPVVDMIVEDRFPTLFEGSVMSLVKKTSPREPVDSAMIAAFTDPDAYNASFRTFRADQSRKRYVHYARDRKKTERFQRHAEGIYSAAHVREFGHYLELDDPQDAEKYLTFVDAWLDDVCYPRDFDRATDFVDCWLRDKPHRLHALRLLAGHKNKTAQLFLRLHGRVLGRRKFEKIHPVAAPDSVEKQGIVWEIFSAIAYAGATSLAAKVKENLPSRHLVSTYGAVNSVVTAIGDALERVITWVKARYEEFQKFIIDHKTPLAFICGTVALAIALCLGYMYAKHLFPEKAREIQQGVLLHFGVAEKQAWPHRASRDTELLSDYESGYGVGYDTIDWIRQYGFHAPQRAFWASVGVLPKLKSAAEAIRYFGEHARDFYDAAVEAVTQVPRPRTALEREVVAFDKKVREVKAVVDSGVSADILAIAEDIDSFEVIKNHLTRLAATPSAQIRPFVSAILMTARSYAEKCVIGLARIRMSAKPRPMAVWLSLRGGQGTRKTTLVREIVMATHLYLYESDVSFVDNEFQDTDLYIWDDKDEFFDQYAGQFYTVLDDMFQSDGTEARQPTARRIISMVAPFPMSLTCANLELKGKVFFTSRALITTTNVADLYTAGLGLESPEALESRRSIAVEIIDATEGAERFRLEDGCVLLKDGKHLPQRELSFDELVGLFAEALIMRDTEHHAERKARRVPKCTLAFASQRCYVPGKDAVPYKDVDPVTIRTYTPAPTSVRPRRSRQHIGRGRDRMWVAKQGKSDTEKGKEKEDDHGEKDSGEDISPLDVFTEGFDPGDDEESLSDEGYELGSSEAHQAHLEEWDDAHDHEEAEWRALERRMMRGKYRSVKLVTPSQPTFVEISTHSEVSDSTSEASSSAPVDEELVYPRRHQDRSMWAQRHFLQWCSHEDPMMMEEMLRNKDVSFQTFVERTSSIGLSEGGFVAALATANGPFDTTLSGRFLDYFPAFDFMIGDWSDERFLSVFPRCIVQKLLNSSPVRFFPKLPRSVTEAIAIAFAKEYHGKTIFDFGHEACTFMLTWWGHYAARVSPLAGSLDLACIESIVNSLEAMDDAAVQQFYLDVHNRVSLVLQVGVALTAFSIGFGIGWIAVKALLPPPAFVEVEPRIQGYDSNPVAKKPSRQRRFVAAKHTNKYRHNLLKAHGHIAVQGQVEDRVKAIRRNLDVVTLYLSSRPVSNVEAFSLQPAVSSYAYCIGGTVYVIPIHVLLEQGEESDQRWIGLKGVCDARFKLTDIEFIKDLGGDLGLFKFPRQLPARPNMVQHFATGEIFEVRMSHLRPTPDLTQITLIQAASWDNKVCHVNPGDPYGPIHTDMIFHGIPNEAGLCGSPYIDQFGMITGFHVAGDKRALITYAKTVFRGDVDEYVPKTLQFTDPIPEVQPAPGVAMQGVTSLGMVSDPKYKVWINHKTRLRETVLDYSSHPAGETDDGPAALSPFTNDEGQVVKPLSNALTKLTSQCVAGPAPKPLGDYSGFLGPDFNAQNAGRVVSDLDAIYGIPGITKGIDMDKSLGYTLKRMGFKSRRQLFPGREAPVPIHPLFKFMLHSKIDDMKNGRPIRPGVVEESLKDEIRDRLRVRLGKTRLFAVFDLDLFVITKMYFDMFFVELEKTPGETPCTIGVDVHGKAWSRMYAQLTTGDRVFRDGDFGSYDYSHKQDGEDEFCVMVCSFHSEPDMVVIIVAVNLRGCWHVVGAFVFLRPWGMSSGSFLTSVLNTFVNWLYHAKAWRALFPDVSFSVVVCFFHGDDSLLGVPREYEAYSCEYLSKYFRETYQMDYTASDKGVAREKALDEITFLKRRFVVSRWGVLAPLELASLANMVKWTERDFDPAIYANVCRSNLIESWHHGPAFYERVAAWVRGETRRLNLPLTVPSFEEKTLEMMDSR